MPRSFVFAWREYVRDDRRLLPSTKLVAYTMSTYMKPDGTGCRPGVETVAWQARLSESTVRRALCALRELCYLTVVRRGGGRSTPTVYRASLAPDTPAVVTGFRRTWQERARINPVTSGANTPSLVTPEQENEQEYAKGPTATAGVQTGALFDTTGIDRDRRERGEP
jgi:hypothetical protein